MIRTFIISILILFCSCSEEFDGKKYLDEKLQKKYKAYSNKEFKKCKKRAEEEASTYVDSLISKWINEDLTDTVAFPSKPIRPNQPEHIIEKWEDPKTKDGSN